MKIFKDWYNFRLTAGFKKPRGSFYVIKLAYDGFFLHTLVFIILNFKIELTWNSKERDKAFESLCDNLDSWD